MRLITRGNKFFKEDVLYEKDFVRIFGSHNANGTARGLLGLIQQLLKWGQTLRI